MARLVIRKGLVNIQGKTRPVIQVIAEIDPKTAAILNEHFPNDSLFKRTLYSGGPPPGVPMPSGSLGPFLANFVKNDACPEVTVKSLIAGQTYQGNSLWETASFEYIAKRSFDSLLELASVCAELGKESYYAPGADIAAFEADAAAERAAFERAA